ncbi:MAG: orotidine-5'-phosphate decarboxylase [Gammaproteobacteria bacterium]
MPVIDPRVIIALDYSSKKQALDFVDRVSPELCKLKIGKELFTRSGPTLIDTLVSKGFDIFLDLKFHDIPNTVKRAIYAAGQLGVWMLDVHALGGYSMLLAAREGIDMLGTNRPYLIAVTLLTSQSQEDLDQLGVDQEVPAFVDRLADLAISAGLDGLVCSAREVGPLRHRLGDGAILVTPGIRPTGTEADDQHRTTTPVQAIVDGSSYLVIGRPITQHANPAAVLAKINKSILD